MSVLICFLNLEMGSEIKLSGRLVYMDENLKNNDDFRCFVQGVYLGISCGFVRCGQCGIIYKLYRACGVCVVCNLCM